MKLITETHDFEESNFLIEADDKTGKENFFIEGIFMQAEKQNRNGRAYPKETLQREVDRYMNENVKKNRAYGELGHPQGPTINLDRVSHMITSLKEDGNNFIGKAKIMDTPMGNIVKALMKEGAGLGVSSRGMGSLKKVGGKQVVQEDFHLATPADIVADPSAPDAYVNGIMESREWVWDNGLLKEVEVDNQRKIITEATMKNLEEKKLAVFQDFLSKL